MANYTTKLRTLCEFYAGQVYEGGRGTISETISRALPYVFDFDYPIWDSAYKETLERKIIRHYFNYEIGQEVPALFKFDLETTLNEIMPYYNELYKTTILEFNPLYSVDYTITLERKYTGKDKQDGATHKEGVATDNYTTTLDRSDTTDSETTGQDKRTDNLSEDVSKSLNETTGLNTTQTGTTSTTTTTEMTETENVTESGNHSDTLTGTKDNTLTGYYTERFSDTPQGSLAGMGARNDGMGNISSDIWLTNATIKDKSETGHESDSESKTGTTSGTKAVTGGKNETVEETGTKTETGSESGTKAETETIGKTNTGTLTHDTTETSNVTYGRNDTGTKSQRSTNEDDGTTSKTGSYEKTDDYVRHVLGKDNKTDYGDLINKLRNAIINIDMMIIKELSKCFMQIW